MRVTRRMSRHRLRVHARARTLTSRGIEYYHPGAYSSGMLDDGQFVFPSSFLEKRRFRFFLSSGQGRALFRIFNQLRREFLSFSRDYKPKINKRPNGMPRLNRITVAFHFEYITNV